jgi:hypothetical protein
MKQIRVIDSHTGGEPTRLVVEGGPDLGDGPLDVRAQIFRERFDPYRSAIVNEPRGSDTVVGALLCAPHRADCSLGVIFFNNVGYLGMCGHGTIGLVASLAHAGRLGPGRLRIDTPVGPVDAELHDDGRIDVANVPSYRKAQGVIVEVAGLGPVRGDVAWGGNWFFLVDALGRRISLQDVEPLTDFTWRVRQALNAQGLSRSGSRGAVRPIAERRRGLPQFRVVPWQGVRPFALRHGHQRQARLPGCRWHAGGRRAVGPGKRDRKRLQCKFSVARPVCRKDSADDQRPRACHRGKHAAARRRRSILLGDPMNEPLLRTMSGQIVTRIRDKILSGDYAPGSALLQDSIAAEFGVSKIPVREALVRLRAEGLIDIEAHRGFAFGRCSPPRWTRSSACASRSSRSR